MSTVTIGCKLPNGIIMQVGEKSVVINGWNKSAIIGATHGITEGVPAELWEAWKKVFADSRLVKDEIVFAAANTARATAKAKDEKDKKSGHEQMPQIKKNDQAGGLGASDER